MCAFMQRHYEVRSNRENGRGRGDIVLRGRKSSPEILLFGIKKDQENVIDKDKNTHYNVFKFLTIRNAVTGRST